MATFEIKAPFPGVFYFKPSPDAAPYVIEGQTVEVGTTIGLLEVLKQFTELQSEQEGTVVSFSVADEDVVEAGQTLIVLETTS